jgi:SAM-dependent methyltransferase
MLLWMAKRFGYRVMGVDISERVFDLQPAFRDQGVDAEFVQADFLDWAPNRQFDVVLSSGFVEHFRNYEEVIRKHWDLVRPGGFLVLTIPAWSPMQRILRRVMYEKHFYQNIVASHHTEMMNLATLRQAVDLCSGGTVTMARYIGEMKIWFRAKHKGVRTWLAPLMIPLRAVQLPFRILRFSHWSFSPGILIVKQKDVEASLASASPSLPVSAHQRFADRRGACRLAGIYGEDE